MRKKTPKNLPTARSGDRKNRSPGEPTPPTLLSPQGRKALSAANRLAGLAEKIRQGVQDASNSLRVAIRNALPRVKGVGDYLLEAQAVCKEEGIGWESWVRENCDLSERSAQAYMRIAKHWDDIVEAQSSAPLSIDGALKLLAQPKKEEPHPATGKERGRSGTSSDAEGMDANVATPTPAVNVEGKDNDADAAFSTNPAPPAELPSRENHALEHEQDLAQKMESLLLAFDEALGRFIVGLLQPLYPSLTYETVEWKEEAPEYVPKTARQLAEVVSAVKSARGVPS